MKSATIPVVCTKAEAQQAFIKKGLASEERARRSGEYICARAVLKELDSMLESARRERGANQ